MAKIFRRLFSTSGYVLLSIYLLVFAHSFECFIITIDEYDGGNALLENGAVLFGFFCFPTFTILDYSGFTYGSELGWLITALFILNLLLNCLLTVSVLSLVVQQIKRMFFSPVIDK